MNNLKERIAEDIFKELLSEGIELKLSTIKSIVDKYSSFIRSKMDKKETVTLKYIGRFIYNPVKEKIINRKKELIAKGYDRDTANKILSEENKRVAIKKKLLKNNFNISE